MSQAFAVAISHRSPTAPVHTAVRREWVRALSNSNVPFLWSQLYRLVRQHPLACFSAGAGLHGEVGHDAYSDLTQELFTRLLSKKRLLHYLIAGMTDSEIEFEISRIELTNLLNNELSKRHPESYRLARRISKLIQTSRRFRRFDEAEAVGSYYRLVNRVYGLSCWPADMPRRPLHEAEQRTQSIPSRVRDIRNVGRTGDSQIIISNSKLEALIVAVLEAADTPLDVRSLRNIVISRLPVMDLNLVPLGGGDRDRWQSEPVDVRENPEQGLLRREAALFADEQVDQFLKQLKKVVLGKAKQYDRMLGVLWHCYLTSERCTQKDVATRLGVSDTLVSDYRQRIEAQLRALTFSEVEQARLFELALRERIRPASADPVPQ